MLPANLEEGTQSCLFGPIRIEDMSLEHKVAMQAYECFSQGNFEACIEQLNKLNGNFEVDNRSRDLNRALVSFANSKWRQVEQFRASITRIFPEETSSTGLGVKHSNDSSKQCAVLFYNLAVVEFHRGHYRRCLCLLDKVYNCSTALTVSACFLRIETYLMLCQAEKALTSIEDVVAFQEREEQVDDEAFVRRLRASRARAYLILRRFRAYRNHAKTMDMKEPWRVALFQAHAEYMTSNRPENAINLLSEKIPTDWMERNVGESPAMIFENVFGCVYGKIGKPNLAAVHFQRATQDLVNKEGVRSLFSCPPLWKWSLMHNLGIAFLKAGRPQAAFDCLLAVIQVFNSNPRLWLRLAECCIMADKPSNESCFRLWNKRVMVKRTVGIGPHRKLILRSRFGNSGSNVDASSGSGAIPVLSLEFASLCLRNAYVLLPALDGKELEMAARSLESSGDVLEGRFPVFQALPGSPLSLTEVHRLKCSILCASSYVSLCLGEAQLALDYAVRLRDLPYLSPAHQFVCRLYAGEACILLEEWKMALEFLDPTRIIGLSVPELWTGYQPPSRQWFPQTLQNAQAVTVLNLAVCLTIKKDYTRASNYLETLKPNDKMEVPIQAIMLGLYLQIQTGQENAAKCEVMQQVPVVRRF